MSGARSRINIYVPSVNRFPELRVIGGGFRVQDAVDAAAAAAAADGELPSLAGAKATKEASPSEQIAAAAMGEELGVGGSGRSLYVIDSQGRRLEHVRYQGDDYRYALRAAINAMPTHWKE
ncbi:hypothetical protein KR093_001809 [Drosophila rubida]|uniref:Uncharacterized protein n=1 Tax=Drosophila rubida TaxID=30044 RepID=A0AAD4PR31_9MUSC|nr:hypothetical protein KR093_001809 [Drosophila rubida]